MNKTLPLKELFDAIHEDIELSSAEGIKRACYLIIEAQAMSGAERDTLIALFKRGPLSDGDVPSKSARASLLDRGFAVQVIVNGVDGYNACTDIGAMAYRLIEAGL